VRTVLSAATLGRRVYPGAARSSQTPTPRPPGSGRHGPVVLVASGNVRERLRLGRRLRRSGFYVRSVSDGPSALASARAHPPAAVVMAWLMPGTGGIDVCARLRQHPTLRRLPVVLLAARGDGAQVAEGFRAGADEVLTRPFDATELVGFLERNMAWAGGR
jgi:two-component system, OmpR family, phosphate regulon response regulator PhoB